MVGVREKVCDGRTSALSAQGSVDTKKKKQNKPYDMCIAISEVYSA